jgi:site-specific recombinase XerD
VPFELYRRHVKSCPHRPKGVYFTGCNCPIWADGRRPGGFARIRRAVGSRDWTRAKRILDRWETEQGWKKSPAEAALPTLQEAIGEYLKDCRARRLSPSTLRSYEKTLDHFARMTTVDDIGEIRTDHIARFRTERSAAEGRRAQLLSPGSLRKEIEALRAFCEFCLDREWLAKNPARKVKPPRDTAPPTLPFTANEVKALLAAVDQLDNNNGAAIPRARARARGLVLLLLYSGMRIGDAVQLRRSDLRKDGRILVRMMKTGEPLYVKLGRAASKALRDIPEEGEYFLWSGASAVATSTGSARRTIDCLGKIAGINAHPHRFRDTFSVELLRTGASLRTVQLLLGHTSIRTTEKHYAPWVRAFQTRLDEATAKLKF